MKSINFVAAVSFTCLIWSDLFNYLVAGTPLVIWKQLIILAFWVLSFVVEGAERHRVLAVAGILIQAILITYSIALGVPGEIAVYNSFLYVSWIPAFVVFDCGLLGYLRSKLGWLWLPLLLGSCGGLLIDLFTDSFSFVSRQGGDQVTTSYLLENNIAKRVGFFFVTSTMVIPLMSILAILALDDKRTTSISWLCAAAVTIGGISTGSLSSSVVAMLISCAFLAAGPVKPASLLPVALVGLAVGVGGTSLIVNDTIALQIDRLLENTKMDSEANIGRGVFWDTAFSDIKRFTPVEHVLGAGLGATNDNKGNFAQYGHGESSFLQAYIECGLLGAICRFAPFLIIIGGAIRRKNLVDGIWSLSALVAVALAPTYGNIPFQMVLGLMIARGYGQIR